MIYEDWEPVAERVMRAAELFLEGPCRLVGLFPGESLPRAENNGACGCAVFATEAGGRYAVFERVA